ncbi:MAG: CpsD/CapB family tyrosine-protein kinase [Desulfobacteraceae bacterium]|nr:CpsD/CapB family tyrosine-protein kinase [Desulfobacteraceae bacterium]
MGKLSKAFEKSPQTANRETPRVKPLPESRQHPDTKKTGHTAAAPRDLDAGLSQERWDRRLKKSTDPSSLFFESFRRLRASVLYPSSGSRPKTLLITSTVPHEGKGFVCANLGVALARGMENHAMMVDCDLRHPSLAQLFGVSGDVGLVDYLQDNADLSLLIRKTGQSKLSLLPAGQAPANPAEILESAKMTGLINEMAERYPDRSILFDSPPGVIASETATLAKQVDGVILVIRYGASAKEEVKRFADTLGLDKILGVVFNAYPENAVEAFLERKLGYGYGYYNYSA